MGTVLLGPVLARVSVLTRAKFWEGPPLDPVLFQQIRLMCDDLC